MTAATGDAETLGDSGDIDVNEAVEAPSNDVRTEEKAQRDRTADDELVLRVQKGDRAAFRALFDAYHRRAFAVAFGVVKNRQDALDIVQEAFIKVHKHIQNFQGSSSFYTWLYRIVMNLSIDHVRRSKKTRDIDYDDKIRRSETDIGANAPALSIAAGANPAKTILRKELSEAIQRALDELPDYHRAVIMLREVEGMSYEEMSEILKVPKGTIMSRLFHARRKMQTTLEAYLQGDLHIEE